MTPRRLFLTLTLACGMAAALFVRGDTGSSSSSSSSSGAANKNEGPSVNTGTATGGSSSPDSGTGGTRSPGDPTAGSAAQALVGVALNANAPRFAAVDQQGKNVYLSDLINKTVVLEWFDPLCDFTKRDYARKAPQKLAEMYADKNVVWLSINSTRDSTRDHNRAWATQHDLKHPVIDDSSQRIAAAYGVTTVPAYVIIDPHGKVVYTGALDDDESRNPEPKEGRTNYVDRALSQLTQGQSIDRPQSRLFGCPLLK